MSNPGENRSILAVSGPCLDGRICHLIPRAGARAHLEDRSLTTGSIVHGHVFVGRLNSQPHLKSAPGPKERVL